MKSLSIFKVALFLFLLMLCACSNSQPNDKERHLDSNCGLSSETSNLITLINAARAQTQYCGRAKIVASGPLVSNCALVSAAHDHAKTLASKNRLSHRGAGNSKLGSRVTASGYQWSAVGENIAKGQATTEDLLDDWLASRKHCKNLLRRDYQEIGVAQVGSYWVAVFATPQ